jgi:hypothetical protein
VGDPEADEPARGIAAPSWPWASANGGLRNVANIDDTNRESLALIQDLTCSGDLQTASGQLVAKGRKIPGVLSYDEAVQPRTHTQYGRVFLMDVEDEFSFFV